MLKLVALLFVVAATANANSPMYNPNLFEGDIAGDIQIDYSKSLAQIPTSQYEKWPGGTVYYVTAGYNTNELNTIRAGMKAIEDQTRVNGRNCITFVQRTNQANYLYISKTGGGCYSYVGKQRPSGAQQVSLDNGCLYDMIVAHELMHALGFFHEQSRPDRDSYVIINLAPVQSQYHHNFQKYSTGVDLVATAYDLMSIMHYENTAFSTNGDYTVIAKSGVALHNASRKSRLTDLDAFGIKRYYGCA